MEEVEFRCTNCGRTVERDILPTKHAILEPCRISTGRPPAAANPITRTMRGSAAQGRRSPSGTSYPGEPETLLSVPPP
ncbi:MAG: hypothetical protein ABEJ07_06395 [Candidatus Nanohaloarchaea archaeon]